MTIEFLIITKKDTEGNEVYDDIKRGAAFYSTVGLLPD